MDEIISFMVTRLAERVLIVNHRACFYLLSSYFHSVPLRTVSGLFTPVPHLPSRERLRELTTKRKRYSN